MLSAGSPWRLHHSAFPPALSESSALSTSLPTLDSIHFIDFCLPGRCVVDSRCLFICTFQGTNEDAYLFTCSLAICMFSVVKGLFKCFVHSSIGLLVLYWLWIKLFVMCMDCKCLLLLCSLPFHSLTVFWWRDIFKFWYSPICKTLSWLVFFSVQYRICSPFWKGNLLQMGLVKLQENKWVGQFCFCILLTCLPPVIWSPWI